MKEKINAAYINASSDFILTVDILRDDDSEEYYNLLAGEIEHEPPVAIYEILRDVFDYDVLMFIFHRDVFIKWLISVNDVE